MPPRLKRRFLRWVRRALAGELGKVADELYLDHDDLISKAFDVAPEILAPLIEEWRDLEGDDPNWVVRAMFVAGGMAIIGAVVIRAMGEGGSPPSLSLALLSIGIPLFFASSEEIAIRLQDPLQRAGRRAARRRFAHRLEAAVNGWLTQQINEAREYSFDTLLTYRGSARLAEIDDPRYEIPTKASRDLGSLLKRMPGGAIGLAGTRGVGKSTLMRSVCEEVQNVRGQRIHSVIVDAPVEYEPRDFILHLFAQVCSQLVGEERVARLRGWNRPFGRRQGIVALLRSKWPLVLGPVLMLAGAVLWRGPEVGSSVSVTRTEGGMALLVLGVCWTLSSVALERSRLLELVQEWTASRNSLENEEHVRIALVRLRQIWFQQTYSSGWGGTFKAPLLALEGKVSSGVELADRQMSYPDVVRLFRDFLELISSEGLEVRIGIDELDKMEADAAQRFLNSIKVVFRIPNCFFFVSVSEEAMSSFERRGVAFRDVFDSSFDAVLRIPHLELVRSVELLHRRVVGLPLPFLYLLHGLAGGLPRDLIRAARELFEMQPGTTLEEAASRLIDRSLRERIHATRVASRSLLSEDGRALLSAWLTKVELSVGSPRALLARCGDFNRDFLDPLPDAVAEADLVAERRGLRKLGREIVCASYLAATLTQFCEELEDESLARDLWESAEAGRPNLVDRLATAFQVFALDLEGAWQLISASREELELPVLEFPPGGDPPRELAA